MARPPGARVRAWSLLGLVITLFLGLAKSGTEEQWLSSTASTSRKPYFWPKFIHQTVPNRANISCEELQLMATWDELNPAGAGYRHVVWDDADIAAFVASHYPLVKDLFDAFLIPVERADIFRYLVLHAFGGVYADADVNCRKPISAWNQENGHDAALLVGRVMLDKGGTLLKIHNWVMASVPRHPVLSRVIHESRAFVTWEFFSLAKEKRVLSEQEYVSRILNRTGPVALTKAISHHITRELGLPLRLPLDDRLVYGDVRIAPKAWLSAGWEPKCDEVPGALACHAFFGSWKGKRWATMVKMPPKTYGCKQLYLDSGPGPDLLKPRSPRRTGLQQGPEQGQAGKRRLAHSSSSRKGSPKREWPP